MSGKPVGEFGLIDWIRGRAAGQSSIELGIGDDCAILRPTPGARLLVTTDLLMDGRHFRLEECGAEAAGYKSLAVNLSDIAAMAGRPTAAFVAVALPKGQAVEVAQGLLAGMNPLAERYGVALAGGDTNAWDGPLVVCVTVMGESVGEPVRRSGARVGDRIYVTGPLGGSLLGRHLRPVPRVAEALALQAAGPIGAMIDLSDGLGSDLGHILAESGGLGAELDEAAIPIHADARRMSAEDGRSALDHALGDGEDFELCFVVDAETAERLDREPPVPGVVCVGRVIERPGIWLVGEGGSRKALEVKGFDHLREAGA